jgi:uncharacterized protein YfaP (DUF2135 family)
MPASLRALRLALLAGGCAAVASCSPEPLAPTYQIQDFISNVTARTGTVIGVVRDTDAPVPATGPVPTVAGIATVVNGGSARISVSADAGSFQRVFISSPSARGHWEVLLPDGVAVEDLVLSVARTVRAGNLRLRYELEAVGGEAGPYAEQTLSVINVGTGDVQVSVAWTGASDVDLHVFDPAGEEIFYANKTAASGGTLDLDSNPACDIDNKNNENIVFPTGAAPTGEYRVVVDYYDDCGVARSDWVVTVQRKDQEPVTFVGSFTGESAVNPPAEVTTFTY